MFRSFVMFVTSAFVVHNRAALDGGGLDTLLGGLSLSNITKNILLKLLLLLNNFGQLRSDGTGGERRYAAGVAACRIRA